ncbi:hypothetical protein A1O3_01512 [Capronia epimyces CBS 606.96]|uniref:FAD-binding FR-type domain-containing protein n=1 Tax=Capronia epimyces CBS 606.96 TaxID=1182542 RepID=W9YUN0_9EURO|nr:uncharacterized protein A1O3_01512 [Capronia epimyces CBS 606.96]EXJ92956.1 hypothetical protein A1O3_01512 [Capronia epimyces CBS 606.96]
MSIFQPAAWNDGEKAIHKRTHGQFDRDNPTTPFLTPRAAQQIQRYQLMAIGTLDENDRPWCTVWGSGQPPMAQPIGQSIIGIRTNVDATFDPVTEAIWKGKTDGEVLRLEGDGKMMAGLSIQLEERGRVKLAGKIIAGALNADTSPPDQTKYRGNLPTGQSGEVQLVVKIDQSLGNCPKYLNRKRISSVRPNPRLVSSSPRLTQEAIDLIHRADLFFVASAHRHEDMDVNHRGGPQGFMRTHQPDNPDEGTIIIWPEYSGNNLYQTLGNLETTPRAGLVIPDFETGDVLYVTGNTETLVGADASAVMAKSKLAVRLKVTEARLVQEGLPFRGTLMKDASEGRSPYNPRVRYLTSEQTDGTAPVPGEESRVTAQLVGKWRLTPTITRYRFALAEPTVFGPWKPGQYVAMDFTDELDMGYSHMRDDDPTSLNDDFIRSFTVSSAPNSLGEHGEEFEITVRKVGSVTRWLEWQRPGRCEVGVRGFGGEFAFAQGQAQDRGGDGSFKKTGFVAAGIGITPLLGQMGAGTGASGLDLTRLKVWWSVGILDIGLALDILTRYPDLAPVLTIYLTGDGDGDAGLVADQDKQEERTKLHKLIDTGVTIERRRMQPTDLTGSQDDVDRWYLCTAPAMRKVVQDWMPGKTIVYETFDY